MAKKPEPPKPISWKVYKIAAKAVCFSGHRCRRPDVVKPERREAARAARAAQLTWEHYQKLRVVQWRSKREYLPWPSVTIL
jgi:hypothetical protein